MNLSPLADRALRAAQAAQTARAARNGTLVDRIAAAATLAAAAVELKDQLAARRNANTDSYKVTIRREDVIFETVFNQAFASIPTSQQRSHIVSYVRFYNESDPPPPLSVFYDGTVTHDITIAGHPVSVRYNGESDKTDDGQKVSPPPSHWSSVRSQGNTKDEDDTLIFTAATAAARDAVIDWITGIAERYRRDNNPPEFYVVKYQSWERLDHIEPRRLDTVFLPDGQLDLIVEDLHRFYNSRPDYDRIGLPWHRGYLFYGPPGTGKTSLARALATHFNLNVWSLALGDLESDRQALALITGIRDGGLLLLEDIDSFAAVNRDTQSGGGLSLSGILNALDGAVTPPGLVTVMTTNTPEVIDPALLRPGRIDVKLEIGWLDASQVAAIWRLAFPDVAVPEFPPPRPQGWTPAHVFQEVQRHFRDPDAAADGIRRLLSADAPPGMLDEPDEFAEVRRAANREGEKIRTTFNRLGVQRPSL